MHRAVQNSATCNIFTLENTTQLKIFLNSYWLKPKSKFGYAADNSWTVAMPERCKRHLHVYTWKSQVACTQNLQRKQCAVLCTDEQAVLPEEHSTSSSLIATDNHLHFQYREFYLTENSKCLPETWLATVNRSLVFIFYTSFYHEGMLFIVMKSVTTSHKTITHSQSQFSAHQAFNRMLSNY